MASDIVLDIENVSHRFGDRPPVLHEINLQVVRGQFLALVGSSGCGKSTLLRLILGTELPHRGRILAAGVRVAGPNRDVGIVYQRYGLYRFLTAQENVAFGLMLDQTDIWQRALLPWYWWPLRRKHMEEAGDLLTRLGLGSSLRSYPHELSGGMQQRVAIAQSLIMRPKILLMDEPFGALDETTRGELQQMMLRLYAENVRAREVGSEPPWTVIFVTHELGEAFLISDRLVGLSKNWYEETEKGVCTGEVMGATKVWDRCTPVYRPQSPGDFELFHRAKAELKDVVLGRQPVERNRHVGYWSDLQSGVGTGVVITKENNS